MLKLIIKISLIFFIIVVVSVICFKIYDNTKVLSIENNSIEYIINDIEGIPNTEVNTKEIIDYIMVLEIPSIGLKKGILSKDDQDNNIEKNVTILKESSYPDEEGNIFIAAHSGNGFKAFFNDLSKLELNDEAYLYYSGSKYNYYVTQIKEIDKNTYSTILTEGTNKMILITCSQSNKGKYLIIYFNRKETGTI